MLFFLPDHMKRPARSNLDQFVTLTAQNGNSFGKSWNDARIKFRDQIFGVLEVSTYILLKI